MNVKLLTEMCSATQHRSNATSHRRLYSVCYRNSCNRVSYEYNTAFVIV
jgi:hypothetical protein